MWEKIEFAHPWFFWLLLVIPVALAWYIWKRNKLKASLKISSIQGMKGHKNVIPALRHLLFLFRLLALAALIMALARPQTIEVSSKTKTNRGIDIVMAIDISSSMLARDLKPNRLEALKEVAVEFVEGRPNDRIGLVIYAGESYTKMPITSDKKLVVSALKDISFDGVVADGTAIGMGLATSVNRLKDSQAKSKVIILLTDGVNNAGFIDPKIATEMAMQFNIKTYTIGLGTNGNAPAPIALNPDGSFRYGYTKVEIDEKLLKEIAKETGGIYFRATDNKKLEDIYQEINKLEKTEIEEFKYTNYEEEYRILLFIAGLLIVLELLLKGTLFRGMI